MNIRRHTIQRHEIYVVDQLYVLLHCTHCFHNEIHALPVLVYCH